MRIIVKKGLDLPMAGEPTRFLQDLSQPPSLALNLSSFENEPFRLLVKAGEKVSLGQPLVENKRTGVKFVSPAGGEVQEIRRGAKRRLLFIVIKPDAQESLFQHPPFYIEKASKEDILQRLKEGGAFPHIRMRPFDLLANPSLLPRDIFVKAIETAPYLPSAESQVEGFEENFQAGLTALAQLTSGEVHLVYPEKTSCTSFSKAKNVTHHTIKGPHPAGTFSLHIHSIDPIKTPHDCVWTLSVTGVLVIGKLLRESLYHSQRILSVAGNGIESEKRGFIRSREGMPISQLTENRLTSQPSRLISGSPLSGTQVGKEDYMGFYDTCFSAIPEAQGREFLHFLRLGAKKYSALRTYLSGHRSHPPLYPFDTNLHGEERAFIDGAIYDQFMPMRIPTVPLVKAILCEDFELAERLGLLEVSNEDFSIATFICPSKVEMCEIVRKGLDRYAKEMGY